MASTSTLCNSGCTRGPRVEKLARETPASFVAFDLLAADDRDLMAAPQRERRVRSSSGSCEGSPSGPSRMTLDRDTAVRWLDQFEGAGLGGVVAKPTANPYQPGKRHDQGEARAHR